MGVIIHKQFLNRLSFQVRPASNGEVHQALKRDLFFDSGEFSKIIKLSPSLNVRIQNVHGTFYNRG